MIVDDHHALAAVLSAELGGGRPVLAYLDARVPATMHLRLVSALYKRGTGRLSESFASAAQEPALRSALLDRIARPRGGLVVLDDRPLAASIGALTAEPGVSVAFGAMIAHGQATGQPLLVDPSNTARWIAAAEARGVEVILRPARTAR